jgi:hypothetical protein
MTRATGTMRLHIKTRTFQIPPAEDTMARDRHEKHIDQFVCWTLLCDGISPPRSSLAFYNFKILNLMDTTTARTWFIIKVADMHLLILRTTHI